jgi:predicted transcriptional regulator
MERVQILLKPETFKKVKILAKKKNISTSGFIRGAVEKELKKETVSKSGAGVLRDAAQKAYKGGPKDLSTNDDYLYKVK